MRPVVLWVYVSCYFGSGLHLGQTLPEVPVSLEDPFELFPSAPRDRIGVSIMSLAWNVRRYTGVGRLYGLPVTEIPRFQLFNCNPGDDLPIGTAVDTSGPNPAPSQMFSSLDLSLWQSSLSRSTTTTMRYSAGIQAA